MTAVIISSIVGPIILVCFQELVRHLRHKKRNVLAEIQQGINDLQRDTLRLQILNLIQHDPENKVTINELYDTYKGKGYNSYITEVYKKWKKSQLKSDTEKGSK